MNLLQQWICEFYIKQRLERFILEGLRRWRAADGVIFR